LNFLLKKCLNKEYIYDDTPPNSLKDSNMSLKGDTTEEGVRYTPLLTTL
jgi:hypothetical protein